MDAGSVGWVKRRGVRKKAPEFIFRGLLLCAFGALLEVEQLLRLHPTGIAQTRDIDPRR